MTAAEWAKHYGESRLADEINYYVSVIIPSTSMAASFSSFLIRLLFHAKLRPTFFFTQSSSPKCQLLEAEKEVKDQGKKIVELRQDLREKWRLTHALRKETKKILKLRVDNGRLIEAVKRLKQSGHRSQMFGKRASPVDSDEEVTELQKRRRLWTKQLAVLGEKYRRGRKKKQSLKIHFRGIC